MIWKFSPGPWLRDRKSGASCDVRAAGGRKIALCWGLTTGDPTRKAYRDECDANANLIAAAPDMLAALLYYRDSCSGNEPSISAFHQMLDQAIAKAHGDEL